MPAKNKITAVPTDVEHRTLYVAIEISRKSWVVGLKSPAGERIGLHPLGAADVEGLRTLIEHHRAKAKRALGREMRVLCCYEAGYEGFWLTRWLDQGHVCRDDRVGSCEPPGEPEGKAAEDGPDRCEEDGPCIAGTRPGRRCRVEPGGGCQVWTRRTASACFGSASGW